MNVIEIEVPIKGTKYDIENKLLSQDFKVFYKVLTISDYYLPINENIENHKTLKERCKRLRYVVPTEKFVNEYQDYKNWIKEYNLEDCKKEEQKIFEEGYRKIYTDIKTDFVYKNIKDDIYFQIQDIQNDCLIIAYDNKKYYEYEEIEQREKLINDVEKYGINIIDKNNVDRFKLVGNIKSLKEIIEIINKQLELLLNT